MCVCVCRIHKLKEKVADKVREKERERERERDRERERESIGTKQNGKVERNWRV